MRSFDAIVLGLGGMGSAALWHLARRGLRVLGIEQFEIAHDRGSSHGDTRIIRKAYFEHPAYVPLVTRAYALWNELEQAHSVKLFHRTGLLLLGYPDGVLISGTRLAARAHDLPMQDLSLDEVRDRFPGFMPGERMEAILEPDAGYLLVEWCVRACVDQAVAAGATVLANRGVASWRIDGSGVRVETNDESFTANRLVICAGPWTAQVLSDLGLPIYVKRMPVFWFAPADHAYSLDRGTPVFAFQRTDGFFYGFPQIDSSGVKVAEHFGGQRVASADELNRTVGADESTAVRDFITEHMPGLTHRILRTSVCMYTMTPDEHFIIDRHPQHPQVAFAAGFSGHGFKFAPVVGSVLADLATEARPHESVGFLRLGRFG